MWRTALLGSLVTASFLWHTPEGVESRLWLRFNEPSDHALDATTPDDRPPFRVEPGGAFSIRLDRGSNYHGFSTITITDDGVVELRRLTFSFPERHKHAFFRLPPSAMRQILIAVEVNRLTSLNKAYRAAVIDGTQWKLLITQGTQEKSVYFDNHFPEPIRRFVTLLDRVLLKYAPGTLRMTPAPDQGEYAQHLRNVWAHVKRSLD